mgnify:CR=1 FL=1
MSQFPGDMSSVFLSGGGFEDYDPMLDMTPGAPGYLAAQQRHSSARFVPQARSGFETQALNDFYRRQSQRNNLRGSRSPSNRSIQDRLGGIADMIRARGDKGARTPPRPPRGGQPPAKNYREQIIGRMPRPEFGRDTIPFVPPYMQNERTGPVRDPMRDRFGPRLPPPNVPIVDLNDPRLPFPGRVPPQIPGFPQPPGRFPQPPRNRFPQPQPPSRFPRPPSRFPQPPGRFPQPFPQPGRKGQRNIPQPGGYYPQPPSSPTYPGRFPSPGRKGNRGSYQQPQMPFGYGQMQDMSSRFGGYGMPQNIYDFRNPDYQPYQPPVFEAPPPGGPTPQPMPQPGPAPDYPTPMPEPPGPMPGPGPGGPGKGRGGPSGPIGGPVGPMPSPGGKGRGGPSPGQLPPLIVENPSGPDARPAIPGLSLGVNVDPGGFMPGGFMGPDFETTATAGGGFMGDPNYYSGPGLTNPIEQQIPNFGDGFGGGMGGGAKMKMGGQTAYPSQNVLSSYMMG